MNNSANKSLVLNVNDLLSDSQSSVEISKTSKCVTFKVKCYNNSPDLAREKAEEIFDSLQEKYSSVQED